MARYNFYQMKTKTGKDKIVCTSTFAGKTVRGVAICDENDTFNLELGKQLAQLRCDQRVAEKRLVRAQKCVIAAGERYEAAEKKLDDMEYYLDDSYEKLEEINMALDELEGKLCMSPEC